MAKKPQRPKKIPKAEELDLDPDAWPRFEALVKSAAKAGHKTHDAPNPLKPKKSKAAK